MNGFMLLHRVDCNIPCTGICLHMSRRLLVLILCFCIDHNFSTITEVKCQIPFFIALNKKSQQKYRYKL